jgi:hypothetical protein
VNLARKLAGAVPSAVIPLQEVANGLAPEAPLLVWPAASARPRAWGPVDAGLAGTAPPGGP